MTQYTYAGASFGAPRPPLSVRSATLEWSKSTFQPVKNDGPDNTVFLLHSTILSSFFGIPEFCDSICLLPGTFGVSRPSLITDEPPDAPFCSPQVNSDN
jgi:hypothetical protein